MVYTGGKWSQMAELRRFNRALSVASAGFVGRALVAFQKKLALDILRGIMEKTPVKTGRAKGAWRLTVQRASEEVVEGVTTEAEVIAMAMTELGQLKPFQTVFISSNLAYILRLEDGWSDQAPHGMVSVTLAEAGGMFAGAEKT